MSAVISEGWAFIKSEEICEKVQSGSTPRNSPFTATGDIPFLKVYNIVGQKINFKYKPQFISREIQNGAISRSKVIENDVLMNIVGPPLGKIAIVTSEYPEWNINQAITLFRANPDFLDYRFLFYFLNEGSVIRSIHGDLKGSVGQVNISLTQCRNFMIPTPPLAEQKVIADKLDELLAQVESTKARLDAIPVILKSFRQSVLAAAVSGQLTEGWRGENGTLKPASISEIEKLWISRYTALGKKFKSPKVTPIQDELTNLPNSWLWTQIGLVCDVYVGATPSRKNEAFWSGTINWVSSSEVAFCRINETKETITDEGLKGTSTNIHPKGTVMLAMIGQGKTRGQPAILDIEACHNQNTAAIRVLDNHCSSEYLYYFLYERYEETRRVGSGNNQQAMNKTVVQSLAFPLPPIEEQTEIVRRVEELFAFADKVEAQVNVAQTWVNNLTRSILAKAFKGELTAEWRAANPDLISGDNSAKALLERIKAERVKLSTKSKPRKSKTKVITNEG